MMNRGITIRLQERNRTSGGRKVFISIICILLALLACAVLINVMGFDAIKAYTRLFKGAFGSVRGISESVLQSIPLMLCALGVSASYKMALNNIGAEGQMMMGAFAATAVALNVTGLPRLAMIAAMFVAAFLAGAIWAVLAVLPKTFLNVSETIITLMFNYIGILWVDYWCFGPWRDGEGSNLPYTKSFPAEARLSTMFGTRVHTGLIFGLVAAVLLFIFFSKTSRGFQIRVIGAGHSAARYAGINIRKNIMLVMLVSGGLAGLAGLSQVSGAVGQLQPSIAQGAGYTGIIIAYISRFNPLVVTVVSLLFGGLIQGGYAMQLLNIPNQVITMIQGTILLFILGGDVFSRKRLLIHRKVAKETN